MGKKTDDDPFKEPLIRITKKYTEDDLINLSAQLTERELNRREDENPDISLSGDTGRDDVPGPYFNWTITGKEIERMLKINEKLLKRLIVYKKRRK